VPRVAAVVTLLLVTACAATTTAATAPPTTAAAATAITLPATTTPSPDADPLIGHSRLGRPIEAFTVGSGPRRVYVVGSIHGDERPAAENSGALLEHLWAAPAASWTIRFVVDANPDGTAAGTRDNAAGVDLNRNWPSAGFTPGPGSGPAPLSEPETAALASDIAAFAPDLILAFHAAREGPFVEFDGAGGEDAAHTFASGASSIGRPWNVVLDVAWGTEGSLGTYFGDEGRVPVVTVEANRWDTPSGVAAELLAGMDALLAAGPARRVAVCDGHAIGVTCAGPTVAAHDLLHAGAEGGSHGFVIKEAGGRVLAALNADAPFYPASSLKLVHFAHALAWIADGGDPGEQIAMPVDGCTGAGQGPVAPLEDLIDRMMQASDNAAANALQAHFGTDDLARTIESAGMAGTRLVHGFGCGGPSNDPANATTAIDLISLLEGIVDGSLVPASAWERVEATLKDLTGAAGLGESTIRVIGKEGWYGTTLTIAGIALRPDGAPLLFAAYTDGAASVDPGFTIAAVAGALVTGSP